MSAENFTYTGSPWGYTAPGWTVFQRSPGISPKAAEALMSYFRYPGPPEGPVRFVYVGVTPSGQRVLAQSRDSGLRWYDESRGHDYFAHVFVEPASAALPPEFNPMSLYMSSGRDGIQTEFPAELKKKALDILKGLRAKEEPPPLAAFDSLSSLPANPAFDKYGLFEPGRLPPGTVAKLPSIVAAVASRVADPDRHPMVLFDVSNRRSLDVMAATMALLPPALRHSASFATYASSDEIASSSPLGAFAFAGVARQGSGGDPDTGVVGELPDAGFAFADARCAALFARIADAVQTASGIAAFKTARDFYAEALAARMTEGNKKGANMGNGTIVGADYSSIAKEDVARVVDALTKEGVPAREILVKAAEVAEKKVLESQGVAMEKLKLEHSRRERRLMEQVQSLSGGGIWKIATMALLAAGILLGGVAAFVIYTQSEVLKSRKVNLDSIECELSNVKNDRDNVKGNLRKAGERIKELEKEREGLELEKTNLAGRCERLRVTVEKYNNSQKDADSKYNEMVDMKNAAEEARSRLFEDHSTLKSDYKQLETRYAIATNLLFVATNSVRKTESPATTDNAPKKNVNVMDRDKKSERENSKERKENRKGDPVEDDVEKKNDKTSEKKFWGIL